MKKVLLILVTIFAVNCSGEKNKSKVVAEASNPIIKELKADGITSAITLINEKNCKMNETIAEYYPDASELCFQSFSVPTGMKNALGKNTVKYFQARFKNVNGSLKLIDYKSATLENIKYWAYKNENK